MTKTLENLRKKARMSYLYLAFAMLMIIAMVYLISLAWGAVAAVAVFVLYRLLLRRDIRSYEHSYRKLVTLHSIGKDMSAEEYVPRGLFTMEEILKDGCVPVTSPKGLVRAGVSGAYRGMEVSMADISFVYAPSRKNALALSGCYVRLELAGEVAFPVLLYTEGAVPPWIPEEYYEDRGWRRCAPEELSQPLDSGWYCCVQGEAHPQFPEGFFARLQKLETRSEGKLILKLEGQQMYVFARSRYLGVVEPVYKYPITREMFESPLFPELKEILALAEEVRERGK